MSQRGRRRKAQALPLPRMTGDSRGLQKVGARSQIFKKKKEWKWQRGIATHPLSESQWNRSHFSLKKWRVREAQKLGHASRKVQRPRCNWRLSSGYCWEVKSMWMVCGAVGYDEELGPLHGMYGSMEA